MATRWALLQYVLFWLGMRLAPALPFALGRRLADVGGLLGYALGRSARAAVRANLTHVLGRPPTERTVRAVFRHGAHNYYDLFRLPGLSPAALHACVEMRGWEHLEAARASGRGVVLVTAHLGSVSFVGQTMALAGYAANIVVEAVQPPALLDLYQQSRSSHGICPVPVGPDLMPTIRAALQRNEIVGLVSDRDVLGNGLDVPFFGAPTQLPSGAAVLALRTGAVVLTTFASRIAYRRHVGWFEPPLELVRTGNARTDVRVNTERITRRIEAAIRRHPEQWTIFQPIWAAELSAVSREPSASPHRPSPTRGVRNGRAAERQPEADN